MKNNIFKQICLALDENPNDIWKEINHKYFQNVYFDVKYTKLISNENKDYIPESKLKEKILERFDSVRQFSFKIGIPYTTVDTILKRGIDKANVGNVKKICKELNISIDSLLDYK